MDGSPRQTDGEARLPVSPVYFPRLVGFLRRRAITLIHVATFRLYKLGRTSSPAGTTSIIRTTPRASPVISGHEDDTGYPDQFQAQLPRRYGCRSEGDRAAAMKPLSGGDIPARRDDRSAGAQLPMPSSAAASPAWFLPADHEDLFLRDERLHHFDPHATPLPVPGGGGKASLGKGCSMLPPLVSDFPGSNRPLLIYSTGDAVRAPHPDMPVIRRCNATMTFAEHIRAAPFISATAKASLSGAYFGQLAEISVRNRTKILSSCGCRTAQQH